MSFYVEPGVRAEPAAGGNLDGNKSFQGVTGQPFEIHHYSGPLTYGNRPDVFDDANVHETRVARLSDDRFVAISVLDFRDVVESRGLCVEEYSYERATDAVTKERHTRGDFGGTHNDGLGSAIGVHALSETRVIWVGHGELSHGGSFGIVAVLIDLSGGEATLVDRVMVADSQLGSYSLASRVNRADGCVLSVPGSSWFIEAPAPGEQFFLTQRPGLNATGLASYCSPFGETEEDLFTVGYSVVNGEGWIRGNRIRIDSSTNQAFTWFTGLPEGDVHSGAGLAFYSSRGGEHGSSGAHHYWLNLAWDRAGGERRRGLISVPRSYSPVTVRDVLTWNSHGTQALLDFPTRDEGIGLLLDTDGEDGGGSLFHRVVGNDRWGNSSDLGLFSRLNGLDWNIDLANLQDGVGVGALTSSQVGPNVPIVLSTFEPEPEPEPIPEPPPRPTHIQGRSAFSRTRMG